MPSDLKPLKPKAEGHGLALLVQWANEPPPETVNQQHNNQNQVGDKRDHQRDGFKAVPPDTELVHGRTSLEIRW